MFGKEYYYGGMGIEYCNPVRNWTKICENGCEICGVCVCMCACI